MVRREGGREGGGRGRKSYLLRNEPRRGRKFMGCVM